MKKFYSEGKEVPSLEGFVEEATGHVRHPRSGQYVLELKIDTFSKPVIVPMAQTLRINKGEKVRVYSTLGFDWPVTGCGDLIEINALQILGEDGEPLFQYISNRDGKFKEE